MQFKTLGVASCNPHINILDLGSYCTGKHGKVNGKMHSGLLSVKVFTKKGIVIQPDK